MSSDASAVLGAPQVAGGMVSPVGSARRRMGGAVGGIIGAAVAMRKPADAQAGTPSFGRFGYLAVSADEIALVKAKSGLMRPKITDEVIARRPRSEVAGAELDSHPLSTVITVAFTDGGAWAFEMAKTQKRNATSIVQTLGGTVA